MDLSTTQFIFGGIIGFGGVILGLLQRNISDNLANIRDRISALEKDIRELRAESTSCNRECDEKRQNLRKDIIDYVERLIDK